MHVSVAAGVSDDQRLVALKAQLLQVVQRRPAIPRPVAALDRSRPERGR